MVKNENITFRIPKTHKEQLLEIAKLQDRTLSYIMQKIVEKFLQENNIEGVQK